MHLLAALTTALATPVIGMAQVFLAEAFMQRGGRLAEIYQSTVWLMMFSVLVSWLVLLLVLPLAKRAYHRFGRAYWLALPCGALTGWLVALITSGQLWVDIFTPSAALTGAVMAAIYCAALGWFDPDENQRTPAA